MKRIHTEGSVFGALGATAAALALLVAWTRELRPGWLLAAGAAYLLALALFRLAARQRSAEPGRRSRPALAAALLLLLGALAAAGVFTWQFERVEQNWPTLLELRQEQLSGALSAHMSSVVERGRTAAVRAAELAALPRRGRTELEQTTPLFRQLDALRAQLAVDAIAVYTDAGNLVAWAGQHRGPLPDSIWLRRGRTYFEERPLFSYLYFPVPVQGRAEHAIAAVLVESGILTDGSDAGIGDVVAAQTNTRATFRRGGMADAGWALFEEGETVVSARLEPLTQQEWRRELDRLARRVVLLFALAVFLALTLAWLRSPRPRGMALLPMLLLLPLAAAAPLGDALGAERLFSPLLFALPLPGDISLGRLLSIVVPVAMLAAGARRGSRPGGHLLVRTAVGALGVALAYPLVLRLLLGSATTALLQGSTLYWLALKITAVLLLGVITLAGLPRIAAAGPAARPWLQPAQRRWLLAAALISSTALALYAAAGARPRGPVPVELAAAWAVPFVLAALALAPLAGRAGALSRWLAAGWIAGTAVLPHLWAAHVDDRLSAAESELETLGTRSDPYLEFLLINFGREALARFAGGEDGVQLLYRTWVASGLAREPYPVHIVLWSATGFPEVQFGSAPPPTTHEVERLLELVDAARGEAAPLIVSFTDLPNLSKLLSVPLADGSLVTVRVPPRRSLSRTSAIAPFLGGVSAPDARLNLVAVSDPGDVDDAVLWERTPSGWRSEALVQYPDGWYHAHLAIALPGMPVLFARGALLLTVNLALFTLLWILGVAARGGTPVPRGDWTGWLGSFRARVTIALFGFFLLPTAVFGWVAYRALAGEVARAAQTVAQHSVRQAVLELQEGAGDLRDLAAHAGTDVLRYQGGELIDVSAREALDLGVYGAWLPPDVYQRLESGEELDALQQQSLGSYSYVTAFRAIRPSGTLGVPMSLSAGDTAQRQQQFAHLVLFAAVMGALLSLALSLAVGRALARPIGMLRRASAAVGAGRLRIHLPERAGDEFGQLFASFNRMTRRLRRARSRELRTARVLAWGEMARQVAHEIKNPLTPIKLSVQHLRRAHADRHPQFDQILESNIDQVLGEIDRLSEIARAFSRYGAPALATGPLASVDVATVVRETLALYRSGDRQVRYIDEVEPGLPHVCARPNELKEVLLNLVENSRAAFDGDGVITMRAAAIEDRVEIEVADNGPGIPPELLPRIFEPHFSTRSSGTGLGLAIVRRLVESWGGTVTAESDAGAGTVLRLRLATAPDS